MTVLYAALLDLQEIFTLMYLIHIFYTDFFIKI